jgi:predicted GH43/DUF377 family glycosyl hydrolase
MKLIRYKNNPILTPKKERKWESFAVYNCGVFYDGKIVHMLYRAVGEDRVSRLGYAFSKDGINFNRYPKPVLEPYPSLKYLKGTKWGCRGIEDPRITFLENKFYVTFIYTSPKWQGARACLATTKDFKKFKKMGEIIPEIDDRNVVLFSEKIKGKYVIYHRILPSIWIAYSDNLKKWYGHKIIMTPRKNEWDCFKIGAAGPPIKTEKGWLLFYHGVDEKGIYRLGVALFDLEDPTKLIARQKEPILEPQTYEELWGQVPNVIFSCGVIEKDEKYWLYYGAADTVICLATVEKNKALDFLK